IEPNRNFGQAQGPAPTENPSAIALIAGGFHTAGLTKAFKKAGVSYVVITPAVSEVPDAAYHDLYEKRLAGERITWEEVAAVYHLSVAQPQTAAETSTGIAEDELS